jgi:hypothetical protein
MSNDYGCGSYPPYLVEGTPTTTGFFDLSDLCIQVREGIKYTFMLEPKTRGTGHVQRWEWHLCASGSGLLE